MHAGGCSSNFKFETTTIEEWEIDLECPRTYDATAASKTYILQVGQSHRSCFTQYNLQNAKR